MPNHLGARVLSRWVYCLIALLSLGGAAQGALLAYDPFLVGANPAAGEYLAGNEDAGTNVLGGQNPTIGPTPFYNGAWIQAGGDSQVVKNLLSLTYPSFQPGLGGLQQETVQFSCCTFGRSGRAIAGGLGFGPGPRTVYESFLINFGTQGADAPTDFGFRGHELWNGDLDDAHSAVSLFVNHFSGVNQLSLRVATASTDTTVPVDGGAHDLNSLVGTHLVVIKYTFDAINPDTVSVYLDPTVGAPEPGVANVSISVANSDLLITHQGAFTQFTFSGATHIPGAIDEIRWGDLYSDVTPFSRSIPEPASAMLTGASVIGLLMARRRR